ncbi:hypothetical protein B0H14DRAFT_3136312 [Mycena olivaceomarginata]|nr:hypothetical protein B0H14DRAFT_3136312 [Mycena olivaceomarginata]
MFSVKSEMSHASNLVKYDDRPPSKLLPGISFGLLPHGFLAARAALLTVLCVGNRLGIHDHQSPKSLAYTVAYFVLCTGSANIFIVRTLLFASRLEAVASNCLKWSIVNIFLFLFPGFAGLLAILSSGNCLRIHRHASPHSIAYTLAYFATFAGSVAVFIEIQDTDLWFMLHNIWDWIPHAVVTCCKLGYNNKFIGPRISVASATEALGSGRISFHVENALVGNRFFSQIRRTRGPSRPARRADRSRMANAIAQDLLDSDSETAPNEKKCKRKSGMKSKKNRDNSDPEDQDFTSGASGDDSDSDIEMIIPNEELAHSLPRKTILENAKRQTAAKPTATWLGRRHRRYRSLGNAEAGPFRQPEPELKPKQQHMEEI